MGPRGPSDIFTTSRGIRQGCPASPTLFGILLSFLERYLKHKFPTAGITIGPDRILCVSYADDFTLVCQSVEEAQLVFNAIQEVLLQFGLSTEASKCKMLVIRD